VENSLLMFKTPPAGFGGEEDLDFGENRKCEKK
jgi:hypothetical protein